MLRYKEIKKLLLDELSDLIPNTRLASRPELCKKLDTSRATLDKAISELIEEGILTSRGGSGTYVASLPGVSFEHGGNWGIILPNVMDAIYPGLVRGVENVAQSYGINVILCNSDNNAEKQEQYVRRLMNSQVSGFIIVPVVSSSFSESYQLYNRLTEAKIPFIFCNRSVDGIDVPVVTSNSFYGGYIATKHLIEKGYRHIAFIAKQKYKTSMERCHGYISALIENGIEVDHDLVIMECANTERPDGYTEMRTLLDSGRIIDAAFCFNDHIAQGVCVAIKDSGLKISKNIGVIGYDNEEMCEMASPRITSVAYKNVEIGQKAAELLIKMIQHEKLPAFTHFLFQPEIVVRDSCKGLGI